MKQPHILLIQSDQHNPFICGYAGNTLVDTPHLDHLAKEGVVFENCYSNSPLCVPSRSSMLSGLLPTHTGVYNNFQLLRSDRATFATTLAIAGYDTVLCGRMHFTGYDQRHGFEKRLVGDLNPSFPREKQRQQELYGPLAGTPDQSRVCIDKSGAGSSAMLCFDRAVTDAACDYLRTRTDERQLFLLVGYGNPHCPFVAPEELFRKYDQRLRGTEEATTEAFDELHPAIQQFIRLRGIEHVTPEELHRVKAAYYANVEYMDGLIGEVISCARETLGEDIVVIYLSDHGESLGSHGMFWKSNFYEESAHVPLIISAPGRFGTGKRRAQVVSLLDIAPTLCDLGEAPHLPKEDGNSLLPLLTDETWTREDVAVSILADIKGDLPSAMIRVGRYKLMKFCTIDLPLLFDLENDPRELNNLAADPAFRDLTEMLLARLYEYWNEDEAMEALDQGLKQTALLRRWAAATKPDSIEEWQGYDNMNYLLPID
ncbi:MAG: sulfatase-like hydrolase/transferase [Lachnospiraceae bacterium]|nr:sulfatase-like hydrolase/transferase [Lachnospiraceae bacterium]